MKQYALLIYSDSALQDALPAEERAKSVRVRNGRRVIVDGPFAETKELLAGFNLIDAENVDDAIRIASEFPWVETGCVEIRQIREVDTVRSRVSAQSIA